MVSSKNILFWSVYDKAIEKGEKLSKQIIDHFEFGTSPVDMHKRDKLLYILDYLNIIKNSKFEYFHIKGLTQISNILNKI